LVQRMELVLNQRQVMGTHPVKDAGATFSGAGVP
jgi:hypothetical protein